MTIAELESPPPRAPGPLLTRSLRRHYVLVFAVLFVPAFVMAAWIAGNLYQQSQGLRPWAWANLWWFVAVSLVLYGLLWLYGRSCFALLKRLYRDGEVLSATIENVHRGRFVGVLATFSVDGERLCMTVQRSGSRVKDGDTCHVLFDRRSQEVAVVLPDAGIIANVDGPHVAQRPL